MPPAIAVLYDFSNEQNTANSLNIIATLAYQGVSFEIAHKMEDEPITLIIDGTIYCVEYIQKYEEDVLEEIKRIKKSELEKAVIT